MFSFTRLISLLIVFTGTALFTDVQADNPVTHYQYEIVSTRLHDPVLFTQGLLIDNGYFYESSGLYGRSLLVRYPVKPSFAERNRQQAGWAKAQKIDDKYFAEGLTLLNDKLYLLTWQEQALLIFNRETFALEQTLPYAGQGWGLTHHGKTLIRTDGSDRIYFHQQKDFKVINSVQVTEQGKPVDQLNELEFINGKIWANIWHQPRIVIVDPVSGNVEGSLDLSEIATRHTPPGSERVLNGIAWDEQQQTLWVTGKMWPLLYQLKITPIE